VFFSVILAVAGLGYFVFYFDPNALRPLLEKRLNESTRMQTELGPLSKDWGRGLKLSAAWLRLSSPGGQIAILEAEKMRLGFNPLDWIAKAPEIAFQTGEISLNLPDEAGKQAIQLRFSDCKAWLRLSAPNQLNYRLALQKDALVLAGDVSFGLGAIQFSSALHFKDLDLESLEIHLVSAWEGRGKIAGQIAGKIELSGSGSQLPQIKQSLKGEGSLVLENGALKNVNVLWELLSQITLFPGLTEFLQQHTAETPFEELLKDPHTSFEKAKLQLKIENGRAIFDTVSLQHEAYSLFASGAADFEGGVNFTGNLKIHQEMSEHLIKKVREVMILANRRGELEIPFLYRGPLATAKPWPDVANLARQVVSTQSAEILQKGLETLLQTIGERKQ
jgi:hypothetical protein